MIDGLHFSSFLKRKKRKRKGTKITGPPHSALKHTI
jgi:hypothetical protein